jgi:hypothetical protein
MKFRVEVICLHADGEQRCSVMEMERAELAMETLGLSVAEGKTMLHGVQDFVACQQAQEDLERRRHCPAWPAAPQQRRGQPHREDGVRAGGGAESTVAPVRLPERRFHDIPAPRLPGCRDGPVRSCSISRRSGPR